MHCRKKLGGGVSRAEWQEGMGRRSVHTPILLVRTLHEGEGAREDAIDGQEASGPRSQ